MAKFIVQLRRGTKEDWIEYEQSENYMRPKEGELVIEYDNGIPRLKIGDGVTDYSQLPYMSVDSFIMPTPSYITLYADAWIEAEDHRWYQEVTVTNATITPNSKVDLQPSSEQLVIFHEKDLAFVAENEDGVVSVFCVGQVPENDYTIQATVMEVATNG
jgi:hypothetical protein